ncbi:MAG TPA: hypothetical protein PK156_25235 [Polyangium sp.]|nr:hypothetical protein [Polyangium sp.]
MELPRVYLVQGDTETEIPDIQFIDTRTMEAVIDADPPILAGDYQFKVVNANGNASNVAGQLRIVDPPVVTAVTAQSNIPSGTGAQICTGDRQHVDPHRQGLPTYRSRTSRRDSHVHGSGQSLDVHRHGNRHERERHE